MTKECECAAHSASECVCGAWDEPQRTWVGLTDKEIETVWDSGVRAFPLLAREIEAKLKEKNT